MPKTIEDRMEDLAKSNWRAARGDAVAFHHHEDLERAIIAVWNAAAKAIKAEIETRLLYDDDVVMCLECMCFNAHAGGCSVDALISARALMEGTDDR